jgi:hypothetical protein
MEKAAIARNLEMWHISLQHNEDTNGFLASTAPSFFDQVPRMHPAQLLIFYHYLQMVLHAPPMTENMLEDIAWHNSPDFVKTAEHASVLLSLLPSFTGHMPLWIVDGTMLAVQVHVILVVKLMACQATLQFDIVGKIDLAIAVLDKVGQVMPLARMLTFGLRLTMTRLAKLGNYFDADDMPPEDLNLEELTQGFRAGYGFSGAGNLVESIESVLGERGRVPQGMKFLRAVLAML